MTKEVIMPKLGLTMEKGILNLWYKQEGEFIRKGEALFEVQTDKINLVVESDYSGFFVRAVANPGEELPIGQIIGYIEEEE
ncbi:MAG: biotin/lipoyl-containing protein [Candidatus Humimicrobiaceae bacterium]